ncbi:longevity-assurance family protein [Plasmopara halstedii]|uniref:Longevity-assurance family protein n=1 Tax=Plasmopara halstedii TaxID=4781 RepID=A0A0N7L4X6_PLAHL|nr:longevity-assurance family protein [Plasmopara halstedii]CEG39899.1 longevity-assurance family protein [Plasmopara halstedii]|eukprot:XP_024576268.1 longevity-assurance family protein [Plasmopara halstedii]
MSTEMKVSLSIKEYVLVSMTLILVPIMLLEMFEVLQERSMNQALHDGTPGMPQFADLLIGGGVSLLLIGARFAAGKAFVPLARIVLSPKKRLVVNRVHRFSAVLFKLIYFVVISIVGFKVMQHEPWFPATLGGDGDVAVTFHIQSEAPSSALKYYFMVQLGYHLHSLLFMVCFSPIRNDFIEMLLHHLATILLISGSYVTNYTAFGALVVYTHDLGDITGYGIKSIVDTGRTSLVVAMYMVLLISWAYTRLYVFPCHLIYTLKMELLHPSGKESFAYPMFAMLCMLLVLHVYWYFLFLVMGYALVKEGVAEDIQQKVEDSSEDRMENKGD